MYLSGKENAYKVQGVCSKDEYEVDIEELSGDKKISLDKLNGFVTGEKRNKNTLLFVDMDNKGTGFVRKFFKKIKANNLGVRFKQMIGAHQILFYDKDRIENVAALISRYIILPNEPNDHKLAATLLARVLAKEGLSIRAIKRFKKAFLGFIENPNAFYLDDDLKALVREMESSPESVVSESEILFKNGAYTRGVNVEEIAFSVCDIPMMNIENIFKNVLEHDMERGGVLHEKIFGRRINGEGLPEIKIIYEKMSEGLFPSMVIEKDGTVRINENFVKFLGFFFSVTRKSSLCKIRPLDGGAEESIGNLYYSIINSMVLSALRGNFSVEYDGPALFNPDSLAAQGERGHSHRYVNTLATLFYWLVIGEGCPYPEARTQLFIEEHFEIFQHLTEEERARLPRHLLQLCKDLEVRGVFRREWGSRGFEFPDYWDMSPGVGLEYRDKERPWRYDVPDAANENTSMYYIFNMLCGLERFFTKQDVMKIAKHEGVDRFVVNKSLSFLRSSGVIRLIGSNEKEEIETPEPVYGMVPLMAEQVWKISEILKTFKVNEDRVSSGKPGIKRTEETRRVKGEVLEVIESRCVSEFLDEAAGETERILAVGTGWVPDEQEAMIQELVQEMDSLHGKGYIKVVRGTEDTLLANLEEAMTNTGVEFKDVVVMDGLTNISKFKSLGEGNNKPVLIGVDGKNLKGDSYIRFPAMLTMALRIARNPERIPENEYIFVRRLPDGTFVFIPKAEALDWRDMKKIYDLQKKRISSAA